MSSTSTPPHRHARPLELVATPRGPYWLPQGIDSDVVVNAMRRGELFEPEIVAAGLAQIRPGTLVLDVGACFGQMAIEFARATGPRGMVLAFEADEWLHGVLRMNLSANGCTNARAVHAAVWERSGTQVVYPEPDFTRFGSYGSYGIDPRAREGRRVRTLAIDDLAITAPVSFLKIDVQGSDLFALRGARQTILRHRMPVLFEFEEQFQAEFGTCWADYARLLDELGYRVVETIGGINHLALPA